MSMNCVIVYAFLITRLRIDEAPDQAKGAKKKSSAQPSFEPWIEWNFDQLPTVALCGSY